MPELRPSTSPSLLIVQVRLQSEGRKTSQQVQAVVMCTVPDCAAWHLTSDISTLASGSGIGLDPMQHRGTLVAAKAAAHDAKL